MIVIFNKLDSIIKNVVYKDFSYLNKNYDLNHFKRVRRNYRNLLIEELLNNNRFRINREDMKLYTEKGEINFSSSYSGYNIAVAISDDRIGIDIEKYENIFYENIDIFTSVSEMSTLRDLLNTYTLLEKATFIWCLKESVGKLYNVGLSKGFKAFNLKKNNEFYLSTKLNIPNKTHIYVYYKLFKDYCLVLSTFKNFNIH